MNIVILGAQGLVGKALVVEGLRRNLAVTAFVEDRQSFTLQNNNLKVMAGDVLDPVRVDRALWSQDAVCIALGNGIDLKPVNLYSRATQHVLKSMRQQSIRRVVCLLSGWVFFEEVPAVHQLVAADHNRQLAMLRASVLDWVAVCPPEVSVGQSLGNYRVTVGKLPTLGVHISTEDIARFMLDQLEHDEYLEKVVGIAE
ncbi:MAG: NAD(P)H-binding protein [Anaerolineales bacterium]|nr:NAD(P)H-binding protein [Anaerolineales bacterium]